MSAKEFWKVMDKNFVKIAQLHNTYEDDMGFGTGFFKKLLGKEFDINYKIPSNYVFEDSWLVGCTIFHLLVRPDLCRILIDHGADYTIKDERGSTVLLKEASSKYERFLCAPDVGDFLECFECAIVILSAHINSQNPKNPIDKNGLSHFHVACMYNQVDVAKFFLENGVSVNQSVNRDSTFYPGYSALHFAVRSCALETVDLLLTLGADVFAKDSKGMNPLHVLMFDRREIVCKSKEPLKKVFSDEEKSKNFHYSKTEQIIYLLLDKMKECGSYVDNDTKLSHFHVLCFLGNVSMIQTFLDNNEENLSQSVSPDSPIWPAYTPLHFAAHSDMETVELLVNRGADLTAKDVNGVTPLDICINEFTVGDVHRILLLQPDYSSIVFSDNKTKLCDFIHAMQETETFGSFLKDNLTDPNMFIPLNSPICAGYTPLHLTIICTEQPMSWILNNCDSDILLFANSYYKSRNYLSRIESCLCYNPDITKKDARGSTPLHWAFKLRQSPAVHKLLERQESNSNPVDEHGLSHLHIACAAGDELVVEKLLSGGANVNEVATMSHSWRDIEKIDSTTYIRLNTKYFINKGSTPLHFAKSILCFKIVKILISNGADVLAKDADDLNPLERLLETPIFQDSVCHERRCLRISHGVNRNIKLLLKKISDELVDTKPNQMLYCYSLLEDNLLLEILSQEDESTMKILSTVGITELHVACSKQNLERVNELVGKTNVNARVDLESPLWPGCTPLHFFLMYSKISLLDKAILVELLENGADVAAMNAKGDTPIHLIFAFERSHSDCVGKVLENLKDFSINPTSSRGYTHLHIASASGAVSIVEKLLEHGAIIDQPVDYFVGLLYSQDYAGCTALHFAAAHQRKDVVGVLLKNGADINRRNAYGRNTLHVAIQATSEQRSFEMLQTLIEAGADVHARDMYGRTPIEVLIHSRNVTVEEIELFLAHDSRVNTVNPMTDNGLLAIALNRSENIPIFEMVIKASDVKDIDENKRNAIHNVVTFIRHDVQDSTRVDVIERFTRLIDYITGIDELIKLGLNIDHQDSKGLTPLHVAAQMQNHTGIVALLENGADINIPDADGKPAFAYSSELAEFHETPKEVDLYILDFIRTHIYKLHLAGIGISRSNKEVYQKIREIVLSHPFGFHSGVNHRDHELESMRKEKISSTSVTFHEFLSDTGAVSAFPYMLPCNRMAIASFFKKETEKLRDIYPKFVGILLLQCRKALARVDMMDPAVTSFKILVGFDMPDICSRITLRFLSNDELINLISSTNNEC